MNKADWIQDLGEDFRFGPRIKKMAISDEVILRFKDLISRRVFTAGAKLPTEKDLASALGVSRPTLRQAIKALQILGVIRSRQGDGTYLAESASEILREPLEFALALKGVAHEDLFETRKTLEVRLASLAAERRTDDDLESMETSLTAMTHSMGTPEEWCVHEMRFHECIVKAARNAVMLNIMEMLSGMLMESRKETVRLVTDFRESFDSHYSIYQEIQRQDPSAAAQAMVAHFDIMEARRNRQSALAAESAKNLK